MRVHCTVIALGWMGACIATPAFGGEPTVSFAAIPAPAGYESFDASSMSGDGEVVIGRLYRNGGGFSPGRWTAQGGFVALPIPSGITSAEPNGVSFDGSVITASGLGSQFYRSFRWTLGSGSQHLGVPFGHMEFITTGTSHDGQRVVGNADVSLGRRAYRWQVGSGFRDLGTISSDPRTEVFAISGDGLTSVGRFTSEDASLTRVCMWTDETGLVPIPQIPGTAKGIPHAVSEHGEAIAGRMFAGLGGPEGRAFYWTSQLGTIDIGHGIASAISADGRVVAGNRISTVAETWIWTQETGRVTIPSILASEGVDLTGWTLTSVSAISADGLTVLGRGRFNGVNQNWIAQVPSAPTGLSALLGLTVIWARRRRVDGEQS